MDCCLPVGVGNTRLPYFGTKVPATGRGLSEPSAEADGNGKIVRLLRLTKI